MLLSIVAVLAVLASVATCYASGGFNTLGFLWQLPLELVGYCFGFGLIAFLIFWFFCAIIDPEKPQDGESPFYRKLAELYCSSIFPLLRAKIELQGMEKLPKDGRFLLVCNHLHILDPVLLLVKFSGSQLAFISKRENSTMFLVGKLMHKLQAQLINRENDREALKTILRCISIIKEDQASVAVFPEGYTSRDGLLHHFRNGVFKIAQKSKVPIVVCTLQNTQHVFHNVLHGRSTPVKLHLVDVIPAEDLEGIHTNVIGDRVYDLMARDLGPELVAEE